MRSGGGYGAKFFFFKKMQKNYPKCKKALDFFKLKCYNILGFRSQDRKFAYIWVWRSW